MGGGVAGGSAGGTTAGGSAVGGGSSGGSAGGAPLITAVDFCQRKAANECARQERCGENAPAQRSLCLEIQRQACARDLLKLDAGSWRFDDVRALACVTGTEVALDAGICRGIGQCDPWVASGGPGAPCYFYECTNGTYCGTGTEQRCRTCAPLKTLGEPCDLFNSCGGDTFCPFMEPADDGGVRRCVTRKAPGQPCGSVFECFDGGVCAGVFDAGFSRCVVPTTGVPCRTSIDCGSSRFCEGARVDYFGGTTTIGTCRPRIAPGGACTNQQEDDGCQQGSCLGGTCRTVLGTQAIGSECDFSTDCVPEATCAGSASSFDDGGTSVRRGTCVARANVDAGCSEGLFDDDVCASGLSCSSNVCTPLGGPGAACPPRCRSSLSCDVTCRTPGEVGAACSQLNPCRLGLACVRDDGGVDGTCAGPRALGARCSGDFDCASGACGNLADGGRHCVGCY